MQLSIAAVRGQWMGHRGLKQEIFPIDAAKIIFIEG